ncbi:MAG: AsmA-like C-terminal region-containing protein, partial [bacterium]|nr:AsmA-like C-terminal region-containing protein [bacterium]
PDTQDTQETPGTQDNSPTEIPPFIIEFFSIEDARVAYGDQTNGINIDMPGIRADLKWTGRGKHTLALDMKKKGTMRTATGSLPIETFTMQAILDSRDLELKGLNIRALGNTVELKGTIKNYASPTPHLDITLRGNFFTRTLAPLTPPAANAPEIPSGTLTIQGRLHGPLPDAAADIHLKADGFSISQPVATSASGTADISMKGFSIDSLRGKGDIRFQPLEKNLPLEGKLAFEFQPNRLNIALHQLKTAGITIGGQLEKTPGGITGEVAVDMPDIKKTLLALRDQEMIPGLKQPAAAALEAGIEGKNSLKIKINGSTDDPRAEVELNTRLLTKNPAPITGGDFPSKGVLSLAARIAVNPTAKTLDARVKQLEISTPELTLKNPAPFRVLLDGPAPAGLKVDNLRLTGGAAFNALPGRIKNIRVHMGVGDEKISLHTVSFDWSGGEFSLSGVVPFSVLSPAAVRGEGFSLRLSARNINTAMAASF